MHIISGQLVILLYAPFSPFLGPDKGLLKVRARERVIILFVCCLHLPTQDVPFHDAFVGIECDYLRPFSNVSTSVE